jgi:hypothetical protein
MHDSLEYNFILKGLCFFHIVILTGALLYNQIPMLITLFLKEIHITWQNM